MSVLIFHGNRSPRADPELVGMVIGLKLSATVKDLSLLYLATVQSISHERHIIDAMNAKGYDIDTLICCGGGTKKFFISSAARKYYWLSNIVTERNGVSINSLPFWYAASGGHETFIEAMCAMSHLEHSIQPEKAAKYHARKYNVFHQLYEDQMRYNSIIKKGI